MRRALHFWVAGGDLRSVRLAQCLQEDGHQVETFAMEHRPDPAKLPGSDTMRGMERADCVILPLPVTTGDGMLHAPLSDLRISVEELLRGLSPGQVVCGGRIPPELRVIAERQKLILRDYFQREELAVANAVPTAEGAIQIAMEELPTTLYGQRVLVIGFGRLGKVLAHRLHGLGAKVTVSARSYGDLAWIEAYGYQAEHTGQLTGWLSPYDLIINTVPARVLDYPQLVDLKEGCLVIDLASRPGGVNQKAAAQLGVKVIWALSLPGKVAPDSAGVILRDTVYHILQELEL